MITMLGLFIVVTYVEQRLIVLPIQPGKRSFMAPTLVNIDAPDTKRVALALRVLNRFNTRRLG